MTAAGTMIIYLVVFGDKASVRLLLYLHSVIKISFRIFGIVIEAFSIIGKHRILLRLPFLVCAVYVGKLQSQTVLVKRKDVSVRVYNDSFYIVSVGKQSSLYLSGVFRIIANIHLALKIYRFEEHIFSVHGKNDKLASVIFKECVVQIAYARVLAEAYRYIIYCIAIVSDQFAVLSQK